MGAPNTVYLFSGNATFPIHLEGEIKLDSYPALPLAIYGDQTKQLFYLDALLMLDDEQGNTAFIGMIKDHPDSFNYHMHNPLRFFKLRLAPEDMNQEYIVLNDSGLNTRGVCTINRIDSPRVNNVDFGVNIFKSSYYNQTTSYGLKHRIAGGSNSWVAIERGTMSPQEVKNERFEFQALPYKAYDVIQYVTYIINEEGEFTSELQLIALLPAEWIGKDVFTNEEVTLYGYFGNLSIGQQLYIDSGLTTFYNSYAIIKVGVFCWKIEGGIVQYQYECSTDNPSRAIVFEDFDGANTNLCFRNQEAKPRTVYTYDGNYYNEEGLLTLVNGFARMVYPDTGNPYVVQILDGRITTMINNCGFNTL